jgi:hypothetical protein
MQQPHAPSMTLGWFILGVGLVGFAISIRHFYEKRIEQNERATDSPETYALIAALSFLVLMGVTVLAMLGLPPDPY